MPAYKDTERNTWYAKFQYTDWTQKTRTHWKRGFKTKKEALSYERDFLAKLNPNADLTIKQLADLYIEDKKNRVKLSTLRNTKTHLNNYILPYLADAKASEITPNDIRKWQDTLIEKGYAKTSLRAAQGAIVGLFKYGIRFHGLKDNPATNAGTMGKKKADRELNYWTKEEYDRFIVTVKDDKYRFLYETLYLSGMRIGELLGLTIQDIDFSQNTLKIENNLVYIDSEYGYVTQTPKSDKSNRIIMMPQFYMDELKTFVDKVYGHQPTDRVFFWTHDKNAVRRHLERDLAKTDLHPITLHGFRHSAASLLINSGANILMIADRLGHENPSITLDIYGHMFPTKPDEIVAKLDKMFTGE